MKKSKLSENNVYQFPKAKQVKLKSRDEIIAERKLARERMIQKHRDKFNI